MQNIVWQPQAPENSQLWHFMRFVEKQHLQRFERYQQLHAWSIQYPELFWPALCDFFKITFDTPATATLNQYAHMIEARWFVGAKLNYAEKLLTRNDDHPALICIDERGARRVYSYHELRQQVAACAMGLKQIGVVTGDRVAALMPNVAQTIIAMLACASLGAIWSSCSPDFGANAAIDRFGQIEPKVLFACDEQAYHGKTHCCFEKIQQIAEAIPSLTHIVICPVIQATQDITSLSKALLWDDFLKPSTSSRAERGISSIISQSHTSEIPRSARDDGWDEEITFTSLPFNHPLYILFSSGTTGKPKCIVHGAGGMLLQHIKELALHTDLHAHDNLMFYTTCGWMMWNWMVSGLAIGATLTLYEGSPTYPDAKRLFEIIDTEKVSVFGTSAKFISAIEKTGISPMRQFPMESLRCILSTGSPLLPSNYDFVYQCIKPVVQLSSISGGTDIASCFALGNPILPVYRGELQCIGLGLSVEIYNEQGDAVKEERGELVCTKPFPAMPIGFWRDVDNVLYKKAYFNRFPGVWAHGDFAEMTAHDGLIIYGRSDAVLNPGGVRIGTAEIYRQVEKITEVVDSVVIGQTWQNDVRIVLFVKLCNGIPLDETLQKKIRDIIRVNASPRHVPAKILQVPDIPRTMNGKIVELAVRQVVQGETVQNVQSLANPEALGYFKDRLELRE
jgi:acetoacetyl-CoA synthetase